jgi:hypothetical protein
MGKRDQRGFIGTLEMLLIFVLIGTISFFAWKINTSSADINKSITQAEKVIEADKQVEDNSRALKKLELEKPTSPIVEPSEYKCPDYVEGSDEQPKYLCIQEPPLDENGSPFIKPLPKPCDWRPILMSEDKQRIYCLDQPEGDLILIEEVNDETLHIFQQRTEELDIQPVNMAQ